MSEARGTQVLPGNSDIVPLVLLGSFGGIVSGLAAAMGGEPVLVITGVCVGLSLAVGVALVRPAALLLAFVVLLPFHIPAMLLMFNLGADHASIRAFSAWKEAAALGLLGVLVMRWVTIGKFPRARALDGIVLAFFLLNFLYLVYPFTSPIEVPLAARAQGFRDNTFFVVLYFVGRLAWLSVSEVRLLSAAAIAMGVAGVLVGISERLMLPITFYFDQLHLDEFTRDYLNLHFHTGIPYNFWTSTGAFRRAVSFHLGSHHFAIASALLFPLVLGLRRPLRPFPETLKTPLLVVFTIGLVLPLTRSVMLACLLQVLVIGWLTRKPHYVLTGVLSVGLLLGVSTLVFDLSSYVRTVVSSPASSLWTHVSSWRDTVDVVMDYPLGVGFGVVDSVAERSGAGPAGVLAGEGEYAFTAASLGVPGLVLFLVMLAATIRMLLRTWQRAPNLAVGQLALVTLAVFSGYVVVGAFTQVRHIPAFLFPLWWLVGSVARGELENDARDSSLS